MKVMDYLKRIQVGGVQCEENFMILENIELYDKVLVKDVRIFKNFFIMENFNYI